MSQDFCTGCDTYTYWSFDADAYVYVCDSCSKTGLTYGSEK